MVLLTDADIKVLIDERKILNKPKEFNPILVEKLDKWEYKKKLNGANKHTFQIYIWKSKHRERIFSVGLFVQIGGDWVPLKRYNGDQVHTNKIEKTRVKGYHIHQATERYQRAYNDIDGFAVETRNYTTWEGALKQLIRDNHVGPEIPHSQQLFKKDDDVVRMG